MVAVGAASHGSDAADPAQLGAKQREQPVPISMQNHQCSAPQLYLCSFDSIVAHLHIHSTGGEFVEATLPSTILVWLTHTDYTVAHVSGSVKSQAGVSLISCAPGLASCVMADCLNTWRSQSLHAAVAGSSL